MYLIDTNIWLEILLRQAKVDEAKLFLARTNHENLLVTNFSVDSIGVILFKRQMQQRYINFLKDIFIEGSVQIIELGINELQNVARVAQKFKLDFDDAYQYAVAEKYNLTIVSFDHDFDQTQLGRKTPSQLTKST
jgi:predicted nucleic acid-binding protein